MLDIKLYEEFRQIHTMDWSVIDLPINIKKADFMETLQSAKFIDLGDRIVAVNQVRSIQKHKLTDEVDLAIARLEEPAKSEARSRKKMRQLEWMRMNIEIFNNYLHDYNERHANNTR